MKTDTLPKLPDLKPDLIPPRGAEPVKVMDDGRVVYQVTEFDPVATKENKQPKLDPEGNPEYLRHPTTGQIIKPKMVAVPKFKTRQIVLRRSGRGHVYKDDYYEPSQEDLDRQERERRKSEILERFAERAAELNMDVDAFVDTMLTPAKEAAADLSEYPKVLGGGWHELSNGEKVRCKDEEAIEREEMLHLTEF